MVRLKTGGEPLSGGNEAHTIFFSQNQRQAQSRIFSANLASHATERSASWRDEVIRL